MKIETKTPVAARSLSGIADMIEAHADAERAGNDPRGLGRLEGMIASTACETLDDARAKIEFVMASLATNEGREIEVECLRTAVDFLRSKV